MGPEKTYETRVKELIRNSGGWLVKYWGGGQFTTSGVPDILACVNGKFLGIEVKGKHGKASELQIYTLHELDKAHGYAILLYPDDWNTFKEFIIRLSKNDALANGFYQELKPRWKKIYDTLLPQQN